MTQERIYVYVIVLSRSLAPIYAFICNVWMPVLFNVQIMIIKEIHIYKRKFRKYIKLKK